MEANRAERDDTRATIELTDVAWEHVAGALRRENLGSGAGIRIGVTGGGCSGYSYTMACESGAREGDLVIERDGVRVFVDPESFPYLEGTTIDYAVSLTREGFQFVNPKASRTCGCGESFGV